MSKHLYLAAIFYNFVFYNTNHLPDHSASAPHGRLLFVTFITLYANFSHFKPPIRIKVWEFILSIMKIN